MQGHSEAVEYVRFSSDSLVIVSGSFDGTVLIWDVTTGRQVTKLFKGDSPIRSVGFSPNGRQVVCAEGLTLQVMDRHTGETVVGPIHARANVIRSVDFSPDGKRLVSGSDDKSVRIWDAQTGKQVAVCGEPDGSHGHYVLSVSFSPNSLYVVSGSVDHTVRVWDAQNGNLILGPLTGHTMPVKTVQLSPDGSHVMSCSDDGTIRFWDASSLEASEECGVKNAHAVEQATSSSKSHNGLNFWLLEDDGWVVDPLKRRLVWVPSDLQVCLTIPLNDLIIPNQVSFKLEFDRVNVGENWKDCYRP
ncbi:unnamed protein product [Rhizoctonia solani]|uniref:Vegetative incompatibility protein HET-E-1 [Podospora anserina] n=1 Tax=Rhizoctonia solani TaxID=456999 RepID=A0A8H3A0D2_9AGAM|nr:unnamed protein product [Rhizoctonia solani]